MGRHPLCRRVSFMPSVTFFKPAGIPLRELEEVCLSVEELEAIRLKDIEDLEQEQCAEKMNISRPTFVRILDAARKKMAEALIKGKAIRIEGGHFEMAGTPDITPLQPLVSGSDAEDVIAGVMLWRITRISISRNLRRKMKILDDLLSTLDLKTTVRDIRLGLFHTAVLSRHCGLAATLSQDALRQHYEGDPLVKEPGYLLNKHVEELARMAYSESLLEAAIGMATINSLLDVDESLCINMNAADLIAEKGKGKKIAIVGHFPLYLNCRVWRRKYGLSKESAERRSCRRPERNLYPSGGGGRHHRDSDYQSYSGASPGTL